MTPVAPRRWRRIVAGLPTPDETLLLRAIVHEGDSARHAWHAWRSYALGDSEDPARVLAAVNVLLPLLDWSLRRNGLHEGRRIGTALRAAALTEDLRWQRFAAICRSAILALQDAGVPVIVLKGAALAETVYPEPRLRHGSDIDLLVRPHDLQRAGARLRDEGWFQEPPSVPPSSVHAPPFIHPSALPLELHHRLLIPYYTVPYERLWASAQPATVAGADALVLSPPHMLLHVCVHGVLSGRILHWVPDAWFLLQRHQPFDWAELVATAADSRLELPVCVALDYLARRIDAPVPQSVLDTLGRGAQRTGFLGLQAARPWPAGTLRELWTEPMGRLARIARLWQRAFPPAVAFALRYDLRGWQVPGAYLRRLWWYAAGRAHVNEMRTGSGSRRQRPQHGAARMSKSAWQDRQ